VTDPRDIGNSDHWALLLAVDADGLLLGTILRLEQIIVAGRSLVVTLAVPDD